MNSLIAVLAITPPSLAFLLFSAVLFLRWRTKKDRETLYFSIAFLFMGLCFGMWVIRTLFYPPFVELSEVDLIIRFGYIFGIAGTLFIGLAAMEMLNPRLIRKKRNLIFFFTPAVSLAILMTFIADPIPAVIAGVTDFVWDAEVSFILSIIGFFYFLFPNYLFIWWLLNNKNHKFYSRIMLMEIGLLIFCSGTIIEASKICMESFGIIVRWTAASGGLIMAYSYLKR